MIAIFGITVKTKLHFGDMPKMGLTLVRASYGDLGHSRIKNIQLQYMFISS